MKALTLKQPWAWAMKHQGKRIENRTWLPPHAIRGGEWFALHAGKGWDDDGLLHIVENGLEPPHGTEIDEGVIIGVARVVEIVAVVMFGRPPPPGFENVGLTNVGDECVDIATGESKPLGAHRAWAIGPYGWILDCVWLEHPVGPLRGFQGMWHLERQVEANVRSQVLEL